MHKLKLLTGLRLVRVGLHLLYGSVQTAILFPFADNVELAHKAGIAAVIQPGGSVRDEEVIDAANKHGICMAFTGVRVFKH